MIWLLGLLAAAAATPSPSGMECARDVITVEGQARIDVKPDFVRVSMLAERVAPSLIQAEAAVKSATDAVLSLARESNVAEADINASEYALQPLYEWGDGKKLRKQLGYRVRRTLVVTLRDLGRFGPFLARIGELGVVSVTDVDADVEQTRSQRDAARLLAVRAAREKAQAIVAELGQSLGRATTIEVDGASSVPCCGTTSERPFSPTLANSVNRVDREAGPTYALGTITLTARVKVAFELK